MRENKYRAYNHIIDSIYKVKSIDWDDIGNLYHINGITVDPTQVTLMQFTGIHDKSGKEIYEGDIVKDCENRLKTVVWKDNGFKFLYISHRTYQGESYTEDVYLGLNNTSDKRWGVEVIGNVFENQELLESEE